MVSVYCSNSLLHPIVGDLWWYWVGAVSEGKPEIHTKFPNSVKNFSTFHAVVDDIGCLKSSGFFFHYDQINSYNYRNPLFPDLQAHSSENCTFCTFITKNICKRMSSCFLWRQNPPTLLVYAHILNFSSPAFVPVENHCLFLVKNFIPISNDTS